MRTSPLAWILCACGLLVACATSEDADIAETTAALTTVRSSDGVLTAGYDINSWTGGYCLQGSVTNVGRASTPWQLVIDLKGTTSNSIWGGTVTRTSSQAIISSQNAIAPNGTASFGVCGVTSTTNRPAVISVSTQATTPICGNRVVEAGEQCDDGNTVSGDGCSSSCLREARCGNGLLESGEQCDDGNTVSGDGCTNSCSIENGYSCRYPGRACTRTGYCGNRVVETGEQCDDGNTVSGDGCSSTCVREARCGNRVVETGEQCDDGNTVSGDGCSSSCLREARCGNGLLESGEQCDDGNTVSGDGCSSSCLNEG